MRISIERHCLRLSMTNQNHHKGRGRASFYAVTQSVEAITNQGEMCPRKCEGYVRSPAARLQKDRKANRVTIQYIRVTIQ